MFYKNFINNLNWGDCILIKGPNGVGKSTLINNIAKYLIKDKKRIGMLMNELFFFENKQTIKKIIIEFYNISFKKENLKNYFNVAKNIKLNTNKKLFELSSGERKKISFLILLILNPDIMFLDEFFLFMDNSTITYILKWIKKINKEKIIFFVCHEKNIIKDIRFDYYLNLLNHTNIQIIKKEDL